MASPDVDGVVKRALPTPYKPGTCGGDINGFHVLYSIEGQTLLVHNVVPGESRWDGDDEA